MDWIPAYFTNVTLSDKHVKGIVRTEKELESVIEIHRKHFNCSFVFWADDKSKKEKSLRRVLWNHKHVGVCRSQESEGQIHPFCITNLIVRACQYGKPRSRKADQEEPDHSYPKRKKLHVQDTRKFDCSAKLFIRRIRSLADIYCSEVLCKETMVSIFRSLSGATYEEADVECSSTEHRSLMKATQNGIRMSNEKKVEWTQKRQKDVFA